MILLVLLWLAVNIFALMNYYFIQAWFADNIKPTWLAVITTLVIALTLGLSTTYSYRALFLIAGLDR